MQGFIQIFTTNNITEAYMVRDILEGNGIKTFIKDEKLIGAVIPAYSIAKGGIKIMISKDNEEKAKEVITDYMR